MNINEVKSTLPIDLVVSFYVKDLQKRGDKLWCKCPFHADSTPSLQINTRDDFWWCWTCGFGGDLFNFVERIENCTFKDAVKSVCRNFNIKDAVVFDEQIEKENTLIRNLYTEVIDRTHDSLLQSPRALEYVLHERGISLDLINKYKIGFSTSASLLEKYTKDMLQLAGFPFDEKTGDTKKYLWVNRIIIPVIVSGKVKNIYFRQLPPDEKDFRHRFLSKNKAIFNIDNVGASAIVTEGIFDALSMISLGKDSIAVLGAELSDWQVQVCKKIKHPLVFLDFDKTGYEKSFKIGAKLNLTSSPRILDYTKFDESFNGQDINKLVKSGKINSENVDKILDNVVSLYWYNEQHRFSKKDDGLCIIHKNGTGNLTLDCHPFKIIVNSYSCVNIEGIKANISFAMNDEVVTKDVVTLYSNISRNRFAKTVGKYVPLPENKIQVMLLNLEKEIYKYLECVETKKKEETEEYSLTEEERAEAENILKSPELFNIIDRDLNRAGLVGETISKLMVYLVMTSRLLPDPLAACVRAKSSSGKSFLLDKVAAFCPPESLRDLSRITQNALYYLDRDYIRNKFLIVREREGQQEADYPIRTLISEKGLVLWYPTKSDDGKIKTELKIVEGPVAYCESTTQVVINEENLNRMLEIYLDETEEQTRKIQERQRYEQSIEWIYEKEQLSKMYKLHQNIQRAINPVLVVIPYHNLLEFSFKSTRNRRDNTKFIQIIKCIALIRQFQKEIKKIRVGEENEVAYVEADLTDYKIAYQLSINIFQETLDELDKHSRQLLSDIIRMCKKVFHLKESTISLSMKDGDGNPIVDANIINEAIKSIIFGRTHIRDYTDYNDSEIIKYIRPLEFNGYLEIVSGGPGRKYEYRLTPKAIENTSFNLRGVLSPEELEAKINNNEGVPF